MYTVSDVKRPADQILNSPTIAISEYETVRLLKKENMTTSYNEI